MTCGAICLAVAAACGGSHRTPVSTRATTTTATQTTSGAAPTGDAVAQLLSSLAVTGRRFTFVDIALAKDSLGISPSASDAQVASALALGGAHLKPWFGSDQPGTTLHGDGLSLNEFSAAVVDQPARLESVPGDAGLIIGFAGHFDAARLMSTMPRVDPDGSTTAYHGVSILSWNDFSSRGANNDSLQGGGTPGQLGVVRGAIFRTEELSTMQHLVDGPGATGFMQTATSRDVLNAMLSSGVYAGAFFSEPWGLADSLLFATPAQADQATKHVLGNFTSLGLGVAATKRGHEMVVVLGHSDRASAAANVSRLRDVFENGLVYSIADVNHPTLVPAASLYTVDSVAQRDDVVVARIGVRSADAWLTAYVTPLNLLAAP